jgi:hypothetical protein
LVSNLDIFNNAIESWNAGHLDGYLSMYDESVALHGYSPEPLNKAGSSLATKTSGQIFRCLARKAPCSQLTTSLRRAIASSVG